MIVYATEQCNTICDNRKILGLRRASLHDRVFSSFYANEIISEYIIAIHKTSTV